MHFYIPTKDDILGSDLIEDPDIYKAFKDYAIEFMGNFNSVIDPTVKKHVELFNRHPDVATRWCCSGHYGETKESKTYFSLVVHSREGAEFLRRVVRDYNSIALKTKDRFRSRRHLRLIECSYLNHNWKNHNLLYPTYILSTRDKSCPLSPELLKLLEESIYNNLPL